MATIGLDKLYYAKITESEDGEETYAPPVQLAKAIKADLSIELAEAVLYADDGAAEVIKDFKSGTLSLGVDDIGVTAAQDLTGAVTDDNGVLISASENAGAPVAIGFRAMKPGGATIMHGRGSGSHDMKVFNIEIQKEKEIIFWLTDTRVSEAVAQQLYEQLELGGEGSGTVFMMPSGAHGLDNHLAIGERKEDETEKAKHIREISTAEELLPAAENNEETQHHPG